MSNAIERAVSGLFGSPSRRTRNIKYFYRRGTTAEQLADYRNRAASQIRQGASRENTTLDSYLLDEPES